MAALVAALGVGGVGAAVVVAQSEDGNPEEGSPGDLRYATPARTSAPQVVSRGATAAGQPYVLRTSRAGAQLCLEIEYGPYPGESDTGAPAGHDGPIARLLTSEVCVDPRRSLSAGMEELFVDPQTGEITKQPQRFVYGVVTDKVNHVSLRSPGSGMRELRTADVPGSSVKVFAGSAPRDARTGSGAVVAREAAGAKVHEHPLTFLGPGP